MTVSIILPNACMRQPDTILFTINSQTDKKKHQLVHFQALAWMITNNFISFAWFVNTKNLPTCNQ